MTYSLLPLLPDPTPEEEEEEETEFFLKLAGPELGRVWEEEAPGPLSERGE